MSLNKFTQVNLNQSIIFNYRDYIEVRIDCWLLGEVKWGEVDEAQRLKQSADLSAKELDD